MKNKKVKNRFFPDGKKANEIISIWMILIFMIIGIVVVWAVLYFYSAPADITKLESKVLSNKLVSAISENGYLKDNLSLSFDILQEAGLDKTKFSDSGDFYFNLSINNVKPISFIQGNKDFEIQCKLEGKGFAECYEKEFFLLDNNGNKIKIKILTGSSQQGAKI